MAKPNIAALGSFVAAGLFVIAAVIPMLRARPLNAAFVGAAVVFFIVGFVMRQKSG